MLLNNFKPLLFFGGSGTFKDVLGNNVTVKDFIAGGNESFQANGHELQGIQRTFNYSSTTATNNFTGEKTAYTFGGVTHNDVNYGDYRDQMNNGFILFIGTGNTSVTANDYCLANAITLDVVSAHCTTNSNGIITVARTFENNTGSSVTISEIGLYIFRTYYNGGSGSNIVMIGRKVLSTPVTIPNGEQRAFEYIIDMNHINFVDADSQQSLPEGVGIANLQVD